MAVLNVTPDSFSDGGRHRTLPDAVAQAWALAEAGADILDVGGEFDAARAQRRCRWPRRSSGWCR